MKVLRDPYIARRKRVIAWILIWKHTPWIRRLLGRDIMRKIGEMLRDDWIILGNPINVRIRGKITSIYYDWKLRRWVTYDNYAPRYLACFICMLPVDGTSTSICHRKHALRLDPDLPYELTMSLQRIKYKPY